MAQLEESALVQTSAAIGRFFHMDPVAVANGDTYQYAFRLAAFNYQSEIERKKAEEARAAQSAKSK